MRSSNSEVAQAARFSMLGLLINSEQLPMAPCPAEENSWLCSQRAWRGAACQSQLQPVVSGL